MSEHIANPKALGFGAFAVLSWMFSMPWAAGGKGQVPALVGVMVFAAVASLIAALICFVRGETWHALFFMVSSAIFYGFHASISLEIGSGAISPSAPFTGWHWLTLAALYFLLWIGAMRGRVGVPAILVALGAWVGLVILAVGDWGVTFLGVVGAYIGLATAVLAFWAAATEIPRVLPAASTAEPAGS